MPGRGVIGVDLGGTKLLAGRLVEGVRARREVAGLSREELLAELASVVAGADAAGIGLPAVLDTEEGVVRECVHLPLAGLRFTELERALGVSVVIDNDANCAALAEARQGAAAGARVAVMLTVGTGIGSGIVVDGEVWRGARGAAGEIGHTVLDIDGPRCRCGSRGCFEALVSGPALGTVHGRGLTGAQVGELALAGDEEAFAAVGEIGRRLGAGVASVFNALDPDVVVIGGGLVGLGDMLLRAARTEAESRMLWPERMRIEPATLGEEAGMVGAALMAA